jgi:hypothetical protein
LTVHFFPLIGAKVEHWYGKNQGKEAGVLKKAKRI